MNRPPALPGVTLTNIAQLCSAKVGCKHHARWTARVDAAQRIESLSLPAGNRTATTYPSAFAATRSCSSTSFRNNVTARRRSSSRGSFDLPSEFTVAPKPRCLYSPPADCSSG